MGESARSFMRHLARPSLLNNLRPSAEMVRNTASSEAITKQSILKRSYSWAITSSMTTIPQMQVHVAALVGNFSKEILYPHAHTEHSICMCAWTCIHWLSISSPHSVCQCATDVGASIDNCWFFWFMHMSTVYSQMLRVSLGVCLAVFMASRNRQESCWNDAWISISTTSLHSMAILCTLSDEVTWYIYRDMT